MTALILIRLVVGKEHSTLKALKDIPGVKQITGVFGTWDCVCTVEAADLQSLAFLVVGRVRAISGVSATDTLIGVNF
ncbi:MAG: Lrp/AsnC ligand binding domain-containing protein [bacterium]